MATVDVCAWAVRALSFVALFQAAGIAIFLAFLDEPLDTTATALARIGMGTALAAVMLALAELALSLVRMGGDFATVLDPGARRVLLQTSAGVALTWRLAGLLVVALGLRHRGPSGPRLALCGAVVVLASFALAGHTTGAPRRWLLSLALLGHLSVVAFWFGGLSALYLVSLRESRATAARTVARFSARALWLVPGLFLAGLLLAALLLSVQGLHSTYGLLLAAKVSGFAALLLLATLNRWRLVPAVSRGHADALRPLRLSLLAELLLLGAVLSVTAGLTLFYSPSP